MRLRLPSIPSVPMPRRITLRWKLAGLLIFIGVLVVALTMVSLASLAKVSDGGQRNFVHVTQPLAALGQRARAGQRERRAGRPPHPRGHPRDQAPARAAHPGQRPPDRARARAGRPHLHHRAGAQERALPQAQPRHLPQRDEPSSSASRAPTRPSWPTSGPRSAWIPPPTPSTPTSSTSTTPRSPRATPWPDEATDDLPRRAPARARPARAHLPHRHPGLRVHHPRHPPQRGGDRRAPGLPAPPRRRRPARRARAPRRRRPDLRADARHAADPPAHARRDRRRRPRPSARSATTPRPRWRPTTPRAPRSATMIGQVSLHRRRRVVGLAPARQRLRGDRPRRGRDRPRRRARSPPAPSARCAPSSSARDTVAEVAAATTPVRRRRAARPPPRPPRRAAWPRAGADAVREATAAMGAVREASSLDHRRHRRARRQVRPDQRHRRDDHRHRRADQPARAQRRHRGGARRRAGPRLRRRRRGGPQARRGVARGRRLDRRAHRRHPGRHAPHHRRRRGRRAAQRRQRGHRRARPRGVRGHRRRRRADGACAPTDIAAAVHQAAEGSSRVHSDMGEVASVAEQTSASTEEVSASTQQTSAAVQQIAAAAQELSGRAEELEALVGRFTLSACSRPLALAAPRGANSIIEGRESAAPRGAGGRPPASAGAKRRVLPAYDENLVARA